MAANKPEHYLFVSERCQHSKRLLMQLQKTPLLNLFTIVNIDNPNIKLPNFVKCVPTLYIRSGGSHKVYTDDDLFSWFQNVLSNQNLLQNTHSSQNTVNVSEITGDNSIMPFLVNEMGNGISGSTYSFLEDNNNDLMNQNFSLLQDNDSTNKMPPITKYDPSQQYNGGNMSMGRGNMSMGGGGNMGMGVQQRKTGGNTNDAYEKMMQARKIDTPQRVAPPTPNFSSPM